MIIDTHCHLIDDAFAGEVDIIIQNALDADVQKMVLACCDEKEFPVIAELCNQYQNHLYPTIGIHPENMAENIHDQFQSLFESTQAQKSLSQLKAVGEIGLDLHWDQSRLADQQWLLEAQILWAINHNLPVLLHIRDAMSEFLQMCKDSLYNKVKEKGQRMRGILHCYSGTIEQAQEALQFGDFLFGIGGTLTYKKSSVPDFARSIGLDKIVLETDAPYLAPVPKRGKRNEPAYTAITCQALAEIMGYSAKDVAEITTQNARQLLGL